jgi:hypothetical protein
MLPEKSRIGLMAVALSLCGGMMLGGLKAQTQFRSQVQRQDSPAQASFNLLTLTPQALQNIGAHLPGYISSVQAQMAYQAKVPLHQEITVKWSAETAREDSGKAILVLVKRGQHMKNSASMNKLGAEDRPILVIATTQKGEVRAFAIEADMRSSTADLDIQLPEDGQVSRLIFLDITSGSPERIGDLDLGSSGAALTGRQN